MAQPNIIIVMTDQQQAMDGSGLLFDLASDPGETRNLFDEPGHLEAKAEMMEELLGWTIRATDSLPCSEWDERKKTGPHNCWF